MSFGMGSNSSQQSSQGSSQSLGVPVNLQNAAFTGLAPGIAAGLASIFQSGPNGIGIPGPGYSSGYPSGATGVTPLNNAIPGAAAGTPGAAGLGAFGGGAGGTGGSGNPQDPSSYQGSPAGYAIPGNGSGGFFSPFMAGGYSTRDTANNPLVAPVTAAQNNTLGQIAAGQNNSGQTPSSINAALQAFQNPNYTNPGTSNIPQAGQTIASFLDPNFAANLATSPQTKAAIGSAIAPLEQSFRTNTTPGLTSAATQAGQRAGGPGQAGSSAFDQAFSNAAGNLQANEGQVAGNIANQAYQAGININANAPALASSFAGQSEQQQTAAQQQPVSISTQELNNLISSLQSEVLPQLTQQQGINNGLNLFNSQIQTIMQALGYGTQAAQPAIAYNTESSGQQSSQGSSHGSSMNFGIPTGPLLG